MSPTLNGSLVIRHFEGSDAIEICNGITLDFYTGLPHAHLHIYMHTHPHPRKKTLSSHRHYHLIPRTSLLPHTH